MHQAHSLGGCRLGPAQHWAEEHYPHCNAHHSTVSALGAPQALPSVCHTQWQSASFVPPSSLCVTRTLAGRNANAVLVRERTIDASPAGLRCCVMASAHCLCTSPTPCGVPVPLASITDLLGPLCAEASSQAASYPGAASRWRRAAPWRRRTSSAPPAWRRAG